ncbi:MAG: hypothetical protein GC171_02420 [Terrimonas sp.]|nr:hypothetical protein [Terrimonas sp.]
MKISSLLILVCSLFSACQSGNRPIVEISYADSLLKNYSLPEAAKAINGNYSFWKKRMDSLPDNFVYGPKLSSALSARFHLFGDIEDLLAADSLLSAASRAYQQHESGILLNLASLSQLEHRFERARSCLEKARQLSGDNFATIVTSFDVFFETGFYKEAENALNRIYPRDNYAYYFRKSKFEHYAGSLDSSIHYMLLAAEKANGNKYLQQAALSNTADLCIHKGDLKKAYQLYQESINLNGTDFHSMLGIGWIALQHDRNFVLARRIFEFVQAHTASPDALLKMAYTSDAAGDRTGFKNLALAYAKMAGHEKYKNMYNKYLITLYTGVLQQPETALQLSEQELMNRRTPQTYAWYAWALLNNDKKEKAYEVFRQFVSGKPLEGPELYYMGKLMQEMKKGYNAKRFLEAAQKNKYDLTPSQLRDLKKSL